MKPPSEWMSATKISTYAGQFGCPRKFYYRYIAKIPGKPSIYFPLGNIPHYTLELFFKLKIYEKHEEYADLRNAIFDLHKTVWNEKLSQLQKFNLGPTELDNYYQESKKMVLNFLHSFLKEDPIDPNPDTERTLWARRSKLMARIDRRAKTKNSHHLIDYKTSKSNKLWDDTKLQLTIQWICHCEETGEMNHKVGAHFLRYPDDPQMMIPSPWEIEKTKMLADEVRSKTRTTDINDYPCTCGGKCRQDFIFENDT